MKGSLPSEHICKPCLESLVKQSIHELHYRTVYKDFQAAGIA